MDTESEKLVWGWLIPHSGGTYRSFGLLWEGFIVLIIQLLLFIMETKNIYYQVSGGGEAEICSVSDGEHTAFVGISDEKAFNYIMRIEDPVQKMLIKAVNNRTRERNYFRLYSEMLEENITEDEFEKELSEHNDDYVLPVREDTNPNDVEVAVLLSDHIKGIDTMDDFQSLFSINDKSIKNALPANV